MSLKPTHVEETLSENSYYIPSKRSPHVHAWRLQNPMTTSPELTHSVGG